MNSSWNFKSYISLPLETDAMKICNYKVSADEIECQRFAEIMTMILRKLYSCESDLELFIISCENYYDLSFRQIGEEVAKKLYKDYLEMKNRANSRKENSNE